MKKALTLLFKYILFYVIGTLLGTFIYLFYQQLKVFVSGGELTGFSFYEFQKCLCYIGACFVFILTPIIIYYRIKRRGSFVQFVFYVLISLAFWNVVLPLSYKGYLKLDSKTDFSKNDRLLTKGLFRESGDKIFFFSKDFDIDSDDESVSTVVIDTKDDGYVLVKQIGQAEKANIIQNAEPYTDILVKEHFSPNTNTYIDFQSMLERAMIALNKGITFWIGFMMMGFAICSLYAFVNMSSWKLINTCLVIALTIGIYVINTIYYLPVCDELRNSAFLSSEVFVFAEKYVDAPLLCLANFLIGLICSLIGIISLIISNHTERKVNKGE